MVESFFGSMQLERLDRQRWSAHHNLANAIFESVGQHHGSTVAGRRPATGMSDVMPVAPPLQEGDGSDSAT